MNLLTGIFVECAIKHAKPDREALLIEAQHAEIDEKADLQDLLKEIDEEGTGRISKDVFVEHMQNPFSKFRTSLTLLGYDPLHAELLFTIFSSFAIDNEVEIDDFVHAVVRLRGNATSLDVRTLSEQASRENMKQSKRFQRVEKRLDA